MKKTKIILAIIAITTTCFFGFYFYTDTTEEMVSIESKKPSDYYGYKEPPHTAEHNADYLRGEDQKQLNNLKELRPMILPGTALFLIGLLFLITRMKGPEDATYE